MSGVPIGIIISNQVFGIFYDQEAAMHGVNGVCYGQVCFRTSFTVSCGLQAMALVLSILLFKERISSHK